ncbi:hypothetical protein XENOCAPTIV_019839 [Xenoophorus captivus]|uniref:Uncharacterized protein n=1 Tax=Xenoophorus captivus TaxID=1517983 RepID=A0ABV0Q6E1_9TELE
MVIPKSSILSESGSTGCQLHVELHLNCCNTCAAQKGPTLCLHAPLQLYLVETPVREVGACTGVFLDLKPQAIYLLTRTPKFLHGNLMAPLFPPLCATCSLSNA